MEQWNFYLSGILYGVCERRDNQIFHQPLDVYAGRLKEWQVLTEEDTWYLELGKMNVREALLRLPDYEAGIAETAGRTDAEDAETDSASCCRCQFQTAHGETFEKKDSHTFIQRNIKFPKDLVTEDEKVIAFITPFRDQCAVLVKEGFEDRTILKDWKEMDVSPLFPVEPPVTEMVPMRDRVRLAADVYLPKGAGKVPAVLVRTPYGKGVGTAAYFRFIQRGYAVVIQDVRGREDSEGEWLPMYYEVEDGDDTLTWIAAQPWSDGNVGMTGGSYLGYVQWAAAASENPHLKAMLSSVCAGSPFIDVPRRGGCFNSGMLA